MNDHRFSIVSRLRLRRVTIGVAVVAIAGAVVAPVATIALLANGQWAAPRQVNVAPSPGSRSVLPVAQIAFRGTPTQQWGSVIVTGSRSGFHLGTVQPDFDGDGGSFLSDKPFAPGETVTVSTNLNVHAGTDGKFEFTIATAERIP